MQVSSINNNVLALNKIVQKLDNISIEIAKGQNVADNLIKTEFLKYDFKANVMAIQVQDKLIGTLINLKA